eukprot:87130-Prymnesium_polylepis.1
MHMCSLTATRPTVACTRQASCPTHAAPTAPAAASALFPTASCSARNPTITLSRTPKPHPHPTPSPGACRCSSLPSRPTSAPSAHVRAAAQICGSGSLHTTHSFLAWRARGIRARAHHASLHSEKEDGCVRSMPRACACARAQSARRSTLRTPRRRTTSSTSRRSSPTLTCWRRRRTSTS